MAEDDKKSLGDVLKKALGVEEEEKKSTKPKTTRRTTGKAKAGSGAMSDSMSKAGAEAKVDAFMEKRKALSKKELEEQREILHSKTHQDLINAVYKVADELKLEGGPWPMLRELGWGHFTDDRGKKYDGPAIDEMEDLDFEKKVALKKALGIK